MNFRLAAGIIISLLLALTLVSAVELRDTKVDYTAYREINAGEAGVIYKIKITNDGTSSRSYELLPDTQAIMSVGTYRIDPSSKITIRPRSSETFHLYVATEKQVSARLSIPVEIKSGSESTTIYLAARSVDVPNSSTETSLSKLLKIAFYILLVLIIISLIVNIFRRNRKKKNEDNENPEVETYY